MATARTRGVALTGVTGRVVEVEADVGHGVPGLHLSGVLDVALSEARDRVRSAVVNSGLPWPDHRITVSLFPADLPKRGGAFDLAIAVAIVGAHRAVKADRVAKPVFLGELGLDGKVRPVRGVLPAVLAAAEAGADTVVVPALNAAEAALVPGLRVIPAVTLAELVEWVNSDTLTANAYAEDPMLDAGPARGRAGVDLSDVAGQGAARRALEICAAGGHHLWMLGAPGTGKTMLAERLPTLLPALDRESALEVTAIHSVAGTLPPDRPLVARPPFCNPHHTASAVAIVGGGSRVLRPGAVSLAHRGVLFLDEAPEFGRSVLDALREPLEKGVVTVIRSIGTASFPARFLLVMAANPCPCAQPATAEAPCRCSPDTRRRYLNRLSGPLMDRIDIKVPMYPPTRNELLADRRFIESSTVVAERVLAARERTAARLAGTPWRTNAEVPGSALHKSFWPAGSVLKPLLKDLDKGMLSARGFDRIVRVAWTIADLDGRDRVAADHINHGLALWKGTPQ